MKKIKYLDVRELTPRENRCVVGSCPGVYELVEDLTPMESRCVVGSCSGIYKTRDKKKYYLVGKKVDPKTFGLEKKVGEGEVLIEFPKEIIDNIER